MPGITVVDEPRKGLVIARETGRRVSTGDVLVYVDADCRVPRDWLRCVAREFEGPNPPVAVTGPYRFYDWDLFGRVLLRMYDYSLAPATHVLAQYVFGLGAVLYGGNFAVTRQALDAIGGFDTTIEFHGEDTNLARRVSKAGRVRLKPGLLGVTPPRAATSRWGAPGCSVSTRGTSARKSSFIARPTRPTRTCAA